MSDTAWSGRFPANGIIDLLDNFPTHNLGESTSRDLLFGELVDLVGIESVRDWATSAPRAALVCGTGSRR